MPASSFDLVAPYYDHLAKLVFGNSLYNSQITFLNAIPENSRVLIIGGGSGWIIEPVLLAAKQATLLYLEASAKMLALAEHKIAHHPLAAQVEWRLGTEENIKPAEKFDVIITNFFLDLFSEPELRNLTSLLNNALQKDGLWLAVDFVKPSGSFLKRLGARLFIRSMYIFFRLTCHISGKTLPDWENQLRRHALKEVKSAYFYGGLIKSSVWYKN